MYPGSLGPTQGRAQRLGILCDAPTAMRPADILHGRLFWGLMAILGLGLLVLVLRHDAQTALGLPLNVFGSAVGLIALALFIGSAVMVVVRNRPAVALAATAFWLFAALIIALGYTYRAELRSVADRVLSQLIPGRPATSGRVVELARGRGGEFPVTTQINGARISTILDTGATSVVLTHDAAKAAGLPVEMLPYTVTVDTANGRTRAAPVTLDRIGVGGLVERSVPALIAQPGQLRVSLLGMTFLDRLESWEVRSDRLVLRGYP